MPRLSDELQNDLSIKLWARLVEMQEHRKDLIKSLHILKHKEPNKDPQLIVKDPNYIQNFTTNIQTFEKALLAAENQYSSDMINALSSEKDLIAQQIQQAGTNFKDAYQIATESLIKNNPAVDFTVGGKLEAFLNFVNKFLNEMANMFRYLGGKKEKPFFEKGLAGKLAKKITETHEETHKDFEKLSQENAPKAQKSSPNPTSDEKFNEDLDKSFERPKKEYPKGANLSTNKPQEEELDTDESDAKPAGPGQHP